MYQRLKKETKKWIVTEIRYHLYKGLEDFCIGGQLRPEDIKED